MSAQRKQDVDALLADLSLESKPSSRGLSPGSAPRNGGKSEDVQSLLDDLEGLVQRRRSHGEPRASQGRSAHVPSEPNPSGKGASNVDDTGAALSGAPSPGVKPLSAPTQTDAGGKEATAAGAAPSTVRSPNAQPAPAPNEEPASDHAQESSVSRNSSRDTLSSWGQWGGNLFSNATRFAGQARHELERRAADVMQSAPSDSSAVFDQPIHDIGNRFAQRFRGMVKDAGLESLGQNLTAAGRRGWSDIVSAVAPPMEAHESVDITLSHSTLLAHPEMVGYDGIESLAFKVLSRILQQADITEVHVHTSIPSQPASEELPVHALHIAADRSQGVSEAKVRPMLTQAAIEPLAQRTLRQEPEQKGHSVTVPDATCPIVLHLQPFYETVLPHDVELFHDTSKLVQATDDKRSVSFLVWWVDPTYQLSHVTCSQAIPAWWSRSLLY